MIKRNFSTASRLLAPRYSVFNNRQEELDKLVPSSLKRIEATRREDNPSHFVESFTSTVVQTDGSTYTFETTLPFQPRVNMVKDIVHHPLWNPRIRSSHKDTNSEEFKKFKKMMDRSGLEDDALADLSYSENAADLFVIKPKQVAEPQQQGKKKRGK